MTNSLKNAPEETKKESYDLFGTGAFAVLNLIGCSVFLLLCLALFVLTLTKTIDGTVNELWPFIWPLCYGLNVSTAIVFMFAVLLFLGIYQKKPCFLLAYFIFGIVLDISLVSAVVTINYVPSIKDEMRLLGLYNDDYVVSASKVIIVISVLYMLLLCMIRRAWILMRLRCLEDHQKLID